MAAQMRALDWSKTPLGPAERWPHSLKAAVRIVLTSRYAMWMCWGPELTFFCNDAYRPTLGVKHTWALGSRADRVWAEIWPDIGPRIDTVLKTGQATWDERLLLFLERSGYPEETYHTFSYSPLADDAGVVVGMLCVVTEETERVIGERRLAVLRELASGVAATQGEKEVIDAVSHCFTRNRHDLPFTLTYLFDPDSGSARLACSSGVPAGHAAGPSAISLDASDYPWPAGQVFRHPGFVLKDDAAPLFATLSGGPWEKMPVQAVVAPVAKQGQDRPAGFLVAGLNPYRRYDEHVEGFMSLLAGQIASGLANARAYEEERRRAEALAELDRAKTTFFSNVSHEFRTPLTLMLGPAEEAMATASDAEQRRRLEVIHRNALRLQKLVNTLLDFSRIEAGRVKASYQATDLTTLTTDLASVFRSPIEKAGIRFLVDCRPLPEPVFVDREMWEKIVLNLLSNAFKFTLQGEIEITLQAGADGARGSR